jgi:UDPglucose 6-dehydrogenase
VHIFVVGAGYVGLTTAVTLSHLGHRVVVHDLDPARTATLADGRSPIFEPGLEDAIREGLAGGRLRFTDEASAPPETEAAVVCVPTPADSRGLLDTQAVESVVIRMFASLPGDRLIAVRSTLPLDGPERLAAAIGAAPGPAVLVNPEFMREGRALDDARHPSRVVVGWLRPTDAEAARRFGAVYEPLGAPTIIADAASVVLMKLASNVFLSTKIAFADELARLSDAIGADVGTVVDGLGMDPRIGRAFLDAGPGFGGSCLPEQAASIAVETERRGIDAPLMGSIARSNTAHQAQIVTAIAGHLPDGLAGARVAVLGLAFKANTDDVRFSPALALVRGLRAAGADVVAYDPVASSAARRVDPDLRTAGSAAEAVHDADAVVVVTEWAEFSSLDWSQLGPTLRGDLVYDTRRIVPAADVEGAGLRYVGLGRRPSAAPAAAASAVAAPAGSGVTG